jgi:hypothetical protein
MAWTRAAAHYRRHLHRRNNFRSPGSPAAPRVDPGRDEHTRDFPQSLPLAANRGPVYLLGTGESVKTPMVSSPVIPAQAGI